MIYNIAMFTYISMLMVSTCFVFDQGMKRWSTGRAYIASGIFAVAGMVPVYVVNELWGY